jgi:hypothetical protein
MTDEETRLTRLVADQGAQIARLTQNASVHKLILEQVKHDLEQERAAVERAVAEERAAVVAWLRNEVGSAILYRADDVSMDSASAGVAMLLVHVANVIERGEHRREEKT